MFSNYDVIVVGAGHAGNEAAYIAGKLGSKVLLITIDMTKIGQMSCNPAMGGIAKGQIIREIDALGGMSGIVTDLSTIQFRMLNRSKGPAMWSPRAQCDRQKFAETWRLKLEQNPNIDFWQDTVIEILIKNNKAIGVKTMLGECIYSKTVILTNGTFLNGVIHIGEKNFSGGRIGEKNSKGLTEQLCSIGFESGRMKTGTPPRLDGRTINFSILEEQKGDDEPEKFSYSDETTPVKDQISCFITYTNHEVHEILKEGFDKSPMFQGRIKGLGPRYCPSIEDKINRFAERERHQLFLEPEGRNTIEIYLNGFSSSLPEEIQYKALKKIKGLENVKIFRPGYAIEYDYFPPIQLKKTLETKIIENLYFAGQINGTTGYEEAAGQGIVAGINAHNKAHEKEEFILNRDEAYIGVLIDDLINKGTEEPYRMFTSRSEYRIMLRQDNADVRLTEKAFRFGCISNEQREKTLRKIEKTKELTKIMNEFKFEPDTINPWLEKINSSLVKEKISALNLLKRPNIEIKDLCTVSYDLNERLKNFSKDIITHTSINIKYESYIEKEKMMAQKMKELETLKIPSHFDYQKIKVLSNESREKLMKIKPETIGQASRISGISASDISILILYLTK